MRILGVDPGTIRVGYGCLQIESRAAGASSVGEAPIAHRVSNLARIARSKVTLVACGLLKLGKSRDPIDARLCRLANQIRDLIVELEPRELALEEAFFGKSVQSALRVGESRGVILAEAARAGLEVHQFPPARVKRSVAGSGAATKEQVSRMVCQTLRLSGQPESEDVTDALAVGLCRIESRALFTTERVDNYRPPDL